MEKVCDRSIPQLEQGSKRACGVKVRSPKEGQAHRRSGAARILGIGEIRGADAPFAHAGVFGKMEIGKEGKGLIVPSNTKADVADVLIKIIVVPPHRNPAPVFHG